MLVLKPERREALLMEVAEMLDMRKLSKLRVLRSLLKKELGQASNPATRAVLLANCA